MRTEVAQRLRVTFGVEEPMSYASVLDMGRVWERIIGGLDGQPGVDPEPSTAGNGLKR